MLCSDTSAVHSIITIKQDEDKIIPVDTHKVFCIAGEAGDRVQFSDYIIANVKLYALRNATELSTKSVAHYARGELAQALRKVSRGLGLRGPSLWALGALLGGVCTLPQVACRHDESAGRGTPPPRVQIAVALCCSSRRQLRCCFLATCTATHICTWRPPSQPAPALMPSGTPPAAPTHACPLPPLSHPPKSPYHCNLLVAGYDKGVGPSLYWMDYLATLHKINTGGTGYGASPPAR